MVILLLAIGFWFLAGICLTAGLLLWTEERARRPLAGVYGGGNEPSYPAR